MHHFFSHTKGFFHDSKDDVIDTSVDVALKVEADDQSINITKSR